MATLSATLHCRVGLPKKQAYTYFSDFNRFAEIHPFMDEVLVIAGKGNPSFRIRETIRLLGPIKIINRYETEVIEVQPGQEVKYSAYPRPQVLLEITFRLEENPVGGYTDIEERIEVKGNPIIGAVVLRVVKFIHTKVLKNLSNQYPA